MTTARPPAVAGMFYPAEQHKLHSMVNDFLKDAKPTGNVPKAIIAPHAGYIYSGPIAASAYACVAPAHSTIQRVVLLGPAHRVPFSGLAATSANSFTTPLGSVPIDQAANEMLLSFNT